MSYKWTTNGQQLTNTWWNHVGLEYQKQIHEIALYATIACGAIMDFGTCPKPSLEVKSYVLSLQQMNLSARIKLHKDTYYFTDIFVSKWIYWSFNQIFQVFFPEGLITMLAGHIFPSDFTLIQFIRPYSKDWNSKRVFPSLKGIFSEEYTNRVIIPRIRWKTIPIFITKTCQILVQERNYKDIYYKYLH